MTDPVMNKLGMLSHFASSVFCMTSAQIHDISTMPLYTSSPIFHTSDESSVIKLLLGTA